MEDFKPRTLGYGMTFLEISGSEIKSNLEILREERRQDAVGRKIERKKLLHEKNKEAMKKLDYALRHGEEIFEPIELNEQSPASQLNDSGIFPAPHLEKHVKYELPPHHPEDQVLHDYNGETPEDPRYWIKRK